MTMGRDELIMQLRRFWLDEDRGISLTAFCEIAGVGQDFAWRMLFGGWGMSERSQIRLSKAFTAWRNGEIAVYRRRDHKVTPEYRREPKMFMRKGYSLRLGPNGGISLDTQPRLRGDYSRQPLFEESNGRIHIGQDQKHRQNARKTGEGT